MTTAFQPNAFQTNAFQIDVATGANIIGVQATSAVGTVMARVHDAVMVAGVQGQFSVGQITTSAVTNAVLVGVQATFQIGEPVARALAGVVVGEEIVATVGTVTARVHDAVMIVGQQATFEIGEIEAREIRSAGGGRVDYRRPTEYRRDEEEERRDEEHQIVIKLAYEDDLIIRKYTVAKAIPGARARTTEIETAPNAVTVTEMTAASAFVSVSGISVGPLNTPNIVYVGHNDRNPNRAEQ